MTLIVIERAIVTDDGRVTVRSGPHIEVRWFCGDVRLFTADDLRDAVDHLEELSEHEDVWVRLSDLRGREFAARIADGVLYADTVPRDGARGVPWRELRRALRRAARTGSRGG